VAELGFWAIAAADPERVALAEADGTEHTAGQLHAACNQVVHGLRALGLQPGDVVATVLPNRAAFIEYSSPRSKPGTWCPSTITCWRMTTPTSWRTAARRHSSRTNASPSRPGEAAEQFTLAALFAVGGVDGFRPHAELKFGQPDTAPTDRKPRGLMNYTSATSQPADGATAGPALEAELLEFCRDRLPKFKTPRSIDFLDDFPRDPSGKLQTPPARPVLGRPQLATGVIGVPATLRSTDSA